MAQRLPGLGRALACFIPIGLSSIGLSAPPAWSQPARTGQLGRQLITAERLRLAGVRRLSDLFELIEDWDLSSVEGLTWEVSPRGLAPLGIASWSVMLDGQTIDLGLFGVRSLDRLPLSVGQIDSVLVFSTPQLHDGEFVDAGLVSIHSRRPPPGLSLQAQLASANETGDPGPFRFTELSTPNIDRLGTAVSSAISYAGTRAYLEVSAKWQDHFVTDPPIRSRNLEISVDEYPIIKQSAASLRASWQTPKARHSLHVGGSRTRDYFFLRPFGREVPVESPFSFAGIRGELTPSAGPALRYRVAYSANALQRHENSRDLDFDWRTRQWSGELAATWRVSPHRATLGAAVRHETAETGYPLEDMDRAVFSAYGKLSAALSHRLTQKLSVILTAVDREVAFKGALAHVWQPGRRHLLEAALSYVERTPAAEERIWLWQARGYAFLADNGVPATTEGELSKTRTIAADFCWTYQISQRLRARLGGYLRSASGLALEDQLFDFDPVSQAFSGPVRLVRGQAGETGALEIGAAWIAWPGFRLDAYYRTQRSLGGDALFKSRWRSVPEQKLLATASYSPWASLDLWARFEFRGSSSWEEYRQAEVQTAGVYDHELDESVTLELGAQKWFWDRRLRVHLLLQDIFDDAVPLHPIGAAYGLSLRVQGELLLGGGWARSSLRR